MQSFQSGPFLYQHEIYYNIGLLKKTKQFGNRQQPYRNLSRRQLIDRIQSLTIESAKHRRGKRYWKNYAQQLENKLNNV